jgi:hypothetical protein
MGQIRRQQKVCPFPVKALQIFQKSEQTENIFFNHFMLQQGCYLSTLYLSFSSLSVATCRTLVFSFTGNASFPLRSHLNDRSSTTTVERSD